MGDFRLALLASFLTFAVTLSTLDGGDIATLHSHRTSDAPSRALALWRFVLSYGPYAAVLLTAYIVKRLLTDFHVECSGHGCDICHDIVNNTFHCNWCINHKCGGRDEAHCYCECHVFKYMTGGRGHRDLTDTPPPRRMYCSCGVACEQEGPFFNFKENYLRRQFGSRNKRTDMHKGRPVYDAVYMGAGLVSLMAAYHLLLHSRGTITVLLIDPRSPSRDDEHKDLKVGESTTMISSLMLFQDLGLHDWLIENAPLKSANHYHWAKFPTATPTDTDATVNTQMTDYYTLEETLPTPIPTYHLHRGHTEAHILSLCLKKGAKYVRATAQVEKIAQRGEEPRFHHIQYTTTDTMKTESVYARHLVDGSGSAHILANHFGLLEGGFRPSNANNAMAMDPVMNDSALSAVWFRIRNANMRQSSLHGDSESLVGKPVFLSEFHNTHHFMGPGYWVWGIPLEHVGGREFSIGVTFYNSAFALEKFNTRDKMFAFLRANCPILYQLASRSPAEVIDFQSTDRINYRVRTMLSPDRWYIMGDAAFGTDSLMKNPLEHSAMQIWQNNTLIMAHLGEMNGDNEPNSEANEVISKYTEAYNNYQLVSACHMAYSTRGRTNMLGNGSTMSFRLVAESAWAGPWLASYLGKWFLCPQFCGSVPRVTEFIEWLQTGLYSLLEQLTLERKNIGLLDIAVPGMLNITNSTFEQRASAYRIIMFDDMISGQVSEFKRANIFKLHSDMALYHALLLTVVVKRGWGFNGFISQASLFWPRFLALLGFAFVMRLRGARHWAFMKAYRIPVSIQRALRYHQMNHAYRPPTKMNSW